MKENKNGKTGSSQARREVILAALAKSTSEALPPDDLDGGEDGSYYTLTREEIAALLSGNIEKIEIWVSSLDRNHATWLLRWLIKESG
jgi:hypothetical protein